MGIHFKPTMKTELANFDPSEIIYNIRGQQWKLVNRKWVNLVPKPPMEDTLDQELVDQMGFDIFWLAVFLYFVFLITIPLTVIYFSELSHIFLVNHLPPPF